MTPRYVPLNQKTFENPDVKDSEGKLATRPGHILDIPVVSKYFKEDLDINGGVLFAIQKKPG